MNRRLRDLGIALAVVSVLGVGAPLALSAPAGAAVQSNIRTISAGVDETCALLYDGTARCWGYNVVGQIGDGTTNERSLPVVVKNNPGTAPLSNVAQISVGRFHACARITDGTARCWGQGGEVGDGTSTNRLRPVTVLNVAGHAALAHVAQISAGGDQTCARLTDGTARCWGVGAMGNETKASRLPVQVMNATGSAPQTNITQIAVGNYHTCVRITDGTARCWGFNDSGGLGDGTTTNHFRPVKVLNVAGTGLQTNITQIVTGASHTCAVITDGTMRCWGLNTSGELGDGTTTDRLHSVKVMNGLGTGPLHGVTSITAGPSHTCARMTDGTARCWGTRKALGNVETTPLQLLPAKVMDSTGSQPMTNVAQITAGTGHSCVRKFDGTARCFGESGEGELGDGTNISHHFAVFVG